MQELAWLLIGWALGLLSGVVAALLVYYLSGRLLGPRTAGSGQTWGAARLLLLVSVPLAVVVLVAASVLLAIEASQARDVAARQLARTAAAETFQSSQATAVARVEARNLTATAASQPTEPAQVTTPTPIVITSEPPAASAVPTVTTSMPELPTFTPEPATSTPRPTKRPTKTPTPRSASKPAGTPQASPTAEPKYAWRGEIVGTAPDCKRTQLEGLALNRDGGLAGNIWIHYWAENWSGAWARSTAEGHAGEPGEAVGRNWDGFLVPYPRAGTWHACVVPGDGQVECLSNQITASTTDAPCKPGSGGVQVVRILFRQN